MLYKRSAASAAISVVLAITALANVACGGDSEADAGDVSPTAEATPVPTSRATEPSLEEQTVAIVSRADLEGGLAFDQREVRAVAGARMRVEYLNDTTIPHNIRIFAGDDLQATTIASSEIEKGPGNVQVLTFQAPAQRGGYLFICDVHPDQMRGHLVVD